MSGEKRKFDATPPETKVLFSVYHNDTNEELQDKVSAQQRVVRAFDENWVVRDVRLHQKGYKTLLKKQTARTVLEVDVGRICSNAHDVDPERCDLVTLVIGTRGDGDWNDSSTTITARIGSHTTRVFDFQKMLGFNCRMTDEDLSAFMALEDTTGLAKANFESTIWSVLSNWCQRLGLASEKSIEECFPKNDNSECEDLEGKQALATAFQKAVSALAFHVS